VIRGLSAIHRRKHRNTILESKIALLAQIYPLTGVFLFADADVLFT
jgi:hypothetical protein